MADEGQDSPSASAWQQPGAFEQIMNWPEHHVAALGSVESSGAWGEFLDATEAVINDPTSIEAQRKLMEATTSVANLRIARHVLDSGGAHF